MYNLPLFRTILVCVRRPFFQAVVLQTGSYFLQIVFNTCTVQLPTGLRIEGYLTVWVKAVKKINRGQREPTMTKVELSNQRGGSPRGPELMGRQIPSRRALQALDPLKDTSASRIHPPPAPQGHPAPPADTLRRSRGSGPQIPRKAARPKSQTGFAFRSTLFGSSGLGVQAHPRDRVHRQAWQLPGPPPTRRRPQAQ